KNVATRVGYAFVLSQRHPKEAWEMFREVLQEEPDNANALYGCGMLVEHERPDAQEAVQWFTRALKARPQVLEARLARALVLARQGHGAHVTEEIDLCVSQDPTGGRTLYGAACFYALLAAKSDAPWKTAWTDMALQLLREAFQRRYGQEKA